MFDLIVNSNFEEKFAIFALFEKLLKHLSKTGSDFKQMKQPK